MSHFLRKAILDLSRQNMLLCFSLASSSTQEANTPFAPQMKSQLRTDDLCSCDLQAPSSVKWPDVKKASAGLFNAQKSVSPRTLRPSRWPDVKKTSSLKYSFPGTLPPCSMEPDVREMVPSKGRWSKPGPHENWVPC